MNDDARMAELEVRLAFQEQALAEVSDALADARAQLARQGRLLERVIEELRQGRGAGVSIDAADEPPPPHY